MTAADLHPDTREVRPSSCCGVCPPIAGGGWDCTCAGLPGCPANEPGLVRTRAERDAVAQDLARLAARLAAVEAEHEALADSLRVEAAQIVSRVSDEPMRQPTPVDELLGIDPNDTAMRLAARAVQAQRQLTLLARRLAAVEALADEWENNEAYACIAASDCTRCVTYQGAVIRLRAVLSAAPTDTTKET